MLPRLINPSKMETTASTSNICIRPVALPTKYPNIQPTIKIIAIKYSIDLMTISF